jgi:ribosomal protein S5
MGSKNHIAVVNATLAALRKLRTAEQFARARGKEAAVPAEVEAAPAA